MIDKSNSWYVMGYKSGIIVDRFNNDQENLRKSVTGIKSEYSKISQYWKGWVAGYNAR